MRLLNSIMKVRKQSYYFVPNGTFLVRFGGISGGIGRAVVRILVRRRRARIPMVRPNEPDMLPKRTKTKV